MAPGALLHRSKSGLARAGHDGFNVSLKVLALEDELIICLAMEQMLKSPGFEVVAAPSGGSAAGF